MIKDVTMHELRTNFKAVAETLARGGEVMLHYRNKPLEKIVPNPQRFAKASKEDPFYHIHEQAVDLGNLTNEAFDEAIYGQLLANEVFVHTIQYFAQLSEKDRARSRARRESRL